MRASNALVASQKQMDDLKQTNKDLQAKAMQSEAQQKHQADVLENVGRVSLLMSFKLADLVNIALEEGSYFRSEEWRE